MLQLFGKKKKEGSGDAARDSWQEFLDVMKESTEYPGEIRREDHLFYDLGLSSMEVMILIGDLEDQLGVHLEIHKLKTVKTVEDLYHLTFQ